MGNQTTGLETYVRGSGWALVALLILGIGACQRTGPREASPADGGPSLQALPVNPATVAPFHNVSAPFDLGGVIRQVHLAFRPAEAKKGGFVGGHATYGVRVDPVGRVRLTPVHHLHPKEAVTGAPVWLQTAVIQRGAERLDTPVQKRHLRPDGRLALHRGRVVELLANTEEGLEQSWRFRQEPAGRGDIEVRVAIEGQRYRGATRHGLHFVDEHTGVGVRYGRATWIDARGRRTELQGRYAKGQVRLRVPAVVVASSAYPAVLDPVIAPEFGMDKPAYGPPVAEQQEPAVAFDGTNYLVVWQDKREGPTWDVLGTRVNASGTVLDALAITISKASNSQSAPAVAFGGGHYLVAWQDLRNGNWDVYGARVKASDATVQEPAGIAISTGPGEQSAPAVEFDGTNYLVVWQDNRNGNWDIYGARLSTAGTVLDTTGLTLSPAVNNQQAPAVAFDGTNYLVVWQDFRSLTDWDVYGARVTMAGSLLDSSGIPVASVTNNQQSPAVEFDGTNYLVVWQDNRNPGTKWDIFGSRVSKAGSVLDPFGIPVSKYDNDQQDQQLPALAFDGTNYLVAWQDNRNSLTTKWDIYGARVSTAGAVVDTGGNPFVVISEQPGSQQHPSVVVGASGLLVAWSDFRTEGANLGSSSGWDIYGTPVSTAGVVASAAGVGIATDLNAQEVPAVAFDGTNYLVVWSDYRTGINGPGWDIYGTRVSATGTVLDSSGLAISTALNDQKEPAVIFGGTQYLVVWEDKRDATNWDIYGARLTTAGAVLESAGLVISQEIGDQRSPAVAHDGTNFLAVWEDRRIGNQWDIYGARVDATGTVVDSAGIAISSAASDQQHPTVAHDGTNFLVVWEDRRAGLNWDIYGARLTGAGSLLDPQGNVISIGSNDQQRPAVVYDGTQSLVVWQDMRNGTHWDIYGARINAQGLPQEFNGIAISGASDDQQFPTAAHDGFNTVVVWQDMRNGNGDIYGARITSLGVVADTQGFAISAGTTDESRPALLGDGDGKVLVAYHRLSTATIYGTNRVQGRMVITHAPNGSPCSAAIDCKSGHCVDAICCDTACGGGVSTDCQACSVTAGAAADGICGVAAAGTACRPVAGDCDLAESCDGSSSVCPADLFEPSTKTCRAAAGDCDVAESCSGTGAACPADAVLPAATVCRAAAGDCDVAESCDGFSTACPADTLAPTSNTCRPAAGECDEVEACSGLDPTCPQDLFKPDGTPCATGTCQSGACVTPPDGGPPEGGPPEGGPPDGGPPDAATGDSAKGEVGAGDLGPAQDALSDTAVARPDSRYCFGPQCAEPGGCGCSVATRPSVPGGLWLLALLLIGDRLRRRTRRYR